MVCMNALMMHWQANVIDVSAILLLVFYKSVYTINKDQIGIYPFDTWGFWKLELPQWCNILCGL